MAVKGSPGVFQIVVFSLLLVLTAVGLAPLQTAVRSHLEKLRLEVVEGIEDVLNRPIAYTGISPSVFRSIEVENLVVFVDDTRRATTAEIGSLLIYYSLWDLLTGPGVDAVREVAVADARISLTEEDLRRSALSGGEGAGGRSGTEFPELPRELTLSATNVDLVLASEPDTVTFRRIIAQVNFQRSAIEFDLRATAGYRVPFTGDLVAADVVLRGQVEEGLERGAGFIEFPLLSYGDWELRNQAFSLRFGNENVAIRKVRNRDPLEISVDIDLQRRIASGRILSEAFRPSSVVSGPAPEGVLPSLLFASVDADAEVEYSFDTGNLQMAGESRLLFPENEANLRLVEAEIDGSVDSFDGRFLLRDFGGGRVAGTAERRGPGRPISAVLDFRNFQAAEAPTVSGTVTLRGGEQGARLLADELAVGAGILYATSIEAQRGQGGITARGITHFNPEETQAMEVSGSMTLGEAQRVDLDASLRRVPIAGVLSIAESPGEAPSAPGGLESLVVDSVFALSVVEGNLKIDAPFVSIYDVVAPEETFLYFSLVQGDEGLSAERISASVAGIDIGGRIVIGDHRAGITPVSLLLTQNGTRYSASAEYRNGGNFSLSGDHDSRLIVSRRREGGVSVSASISDAPARPLGEGARLTAAIDGYFASFESWSARLQRLDLVDVSSPTGTLALRARGVFDPSGGQLAPLTIDDGVDTLSGSVGVSIGEEDLGAVINGTLTSGDGAEALGLSGSFDASAVALNLQGDNIGLRRLGITGLRGQMSFAAEAAGPPGDLSLRGTVSIPEGRLAGEAFTGSGRFALSDESLRVQGVEVRRGENRLDVTTATVDLSRGTIALGARLTRGLSPAEAVTNLDLRYQRRVDEPFSAIRQVVSDPFSAEIRLSGVTVVGVPEEEWVFSLRRTTSGVTLRGAPGNAVRAQISNAGDFRLVLTDPLPLRLQAAGFVGEGRVEATITRISAELPFTETPTEASEEQRPGGRFVPLRGDIEGSLRVIGPLNDPDIFGTVSVENIEAEVPYVQGVVSAPQAFVLFQEKMIQVDRFFAARGDAGATVAATLLLSRWGLDQFEVLINTVGDEGMPISQNFGPLAVDGTGLGSFRIFGTPATIDLSGEITAEETTITLITEDVDEQEPRKITTVDLTLVAGRRLEFLWPSREVPILRAFARAGDQVRLVSASEDESFGLDGTVSIRGGEIFYVNRNFYMRQGRIVFDEDEAGFDPVLSARAELREVGPRGPVRIFLIAEESPLSQFAPRLESTPPLTNDEIIALLGGAILEEGSTDVANLGSAVAVTSEVVTQFGLMNQFERQVREALNVDLFSVRTQVFQNIVIGSLDQSEVPLDTTAPSLGTYLDNTTVFLGKYLGSDLFLELLIELRARDPLDQNVIAIGGMEVDPEIGLEFDTPFFLLQWSFFPRTPETLFVADNTFEFSWQFSY